MSFFNNILNKLGFNSAQAAAPDTATPVTAAESTAEVTQSPLAPTASAAIEKVDVISQLEERAAANPQKLNWKTSIVDLLKLLDLDSSLAIRKELASELDCPAELMGDSAQMNMWLHKEVLQRLAANGGNIPAELLG